MEELPILNQGPTLEAVRPNPELLAQGWKQRNLTDPERIEEVTELYESVGFEVRAESLKASDFGSECSSCAASACTNYVLLYTRPVSRPDNS